MYHVELRQPPHTIRRLNLDERELSEALMGPWARGEQALIGEQRWDPGAAEVTVIEGPEIEVGRLTMGRGWSVARKEGVDVTAQVLAAIAEGAGRHRAAAAAGAATSAAASTPAGGAAGPPAASTQAAAAASAPGVAASPHAASTQAAAPGLPAAVVPPSVAASAPAGAPAEPAAAAQTAAATSSGAAGLAGAAHATGVAPHAGSLDTLADALGMELLRRLGAGPMSLQEAWLLTAERHADLGAGESLTLTALAVASLARSGLAAVTRGRPGAEQAQPVPEQELDGVVRSPQSWAQHGGGDAVWLHRS